MEGGTNRNSINGSPSSRDASSVAAHEEPLPRRGWTRFSEGLLNPVLPFSTGSSRSNNHNQYISPPSYPPRRSNPPSGNSLDYDGNTVTDRMDTGVRARGQGNVSPEDERRKKRRTETEGVHRGTGAALDLDVEVVERPAIVNVKLLESQLETAMKNVKEWERRRDELKKEMAQTSEKLANAQQLVDSLRGSVVAAKQLLSSDSSRGWLPPSGDGSSLGTGVAAHRGNSSSSSSKSPLSKNGPASRVVSPPLPTVLQSSRSPTVPAPAHSSSATLSASTSRTVSTSTQLPSSSLPIHSSGREREDRLQEYDYNTLKIRYGKQDVVKNISRLKINGGAMNPHDNDLFAVFDNDPNKGKLCIYKLKQGESGHVLRMQKQFESSVLGSSAESPAFNEPRPINSIAWSPNGEKIIVNFSENDNTRALKTTMDNMSVVLTYNSESTETVGHFDTNSCNKAATFLDNDRFLICHQKKIYMMGKDELRGKKPALLHSLHSCDVTATKWLSREKWLLSGGTNEKILCYDIEKKLHYQIELSDVPNGGGEGAKKHHRINYMNSVPNMPQSVVLFSSVVTPGGPHHALIYDIRASHKTCMGFFPLNGTNTSMSVLPSMCPSGIILSCGGSGPDMNGMVALYDIRRIRDGHSTLSSNMVLKTTHEKGVVTTCEWHNYRKVQYTLAAVEKELGAVEYAI